MQKGDFDPHLGVFSGVYVAVMYVAVMYALFFSRMHSDVAA